MLIPADKIKVTVRNGWVTLDGEVDWQYQRNLAESSVKKLKGVIGINNNILIKPKLTPSEVKQKIEEALKRSAEIDARRVTVDVEGSSVILHGSVRSWAEEGGGGARGLVRAGSDKVKNYIYIAP